LILHWTSDETLPPSNAIGGGKYDSAAWTATRMENVVWRLATELEGEAVAYGACLNLY